MSQRLNDYFSQEATDYLAQLEELLAGEGAPDAGELVRLARGVRGSAQMGGAQTIAGVAERLEDAARSLQSHTIVWSEEVRRLAMETVSDLQLLVRALNRWGPEEEARVRSALGRWDEVPSAEERNDASAAVVSIESLFFDDAGPHILSAPEIVAVEALLFRGEAALREALRLREELERLAAEGGERAALAERLRELFDLVELGLAPAVPAR